MDINKEIIMTIVKNSKGRLEYDQEFFEINEQQLATISKELTKLFSLHGVVVSDCLGVKVDKSKATHKVEIRDTVFRKGSSLNNN